MTMMFIPVQNQSSSKEDSSLFDYLPLFKSKPLMLLMAHITIHDRSLLDFCRYVPASVYEGVRCQPCAFWLLSRGISLTLYIGMIILPFILMSVITLFRVINNEEVMKFGDIK
jgi:hypothetical protein